MWHIYQTLTSDVTKDYSGNGGNKFKVKLGLKLPGEGWKVSIVSAMLPRMALFKDLQRKTENLVELWFDLEGVSTLNKRKKAGLHGNDLQAWEKDYKCRTGVEFMNEVKSLLDERRNILIPKGKKVLDAQWVKLEWKREAGEPELLMHHSDPGTGNRILRKFADTMDWLNTANDKDDHAGMNLLISHPAHKRDTTDLANGEAHKLDASWMMLSSKADFRFINLNASFADALNLHARPLTVTAKVTSGSATITQPLGQVYYAPHGRERYLFTPPVEEFHPIYTPDWNEVEISLQELGGSLVNFQSDSQCVLRVHFQQD